MTEHEKELNRQAYALLGVHRMIPEDELADWLAEIGYGIDFGIGMPDAPVSLEALAAAYMRQNPAPGETLEDYAWTITQETGALSPTA